MPMATPEEQRAYQREWIRQRRSAWIDANGPCARCGSGDRLEVDHIDRTTKTYNPKQIWSLSRAKRDAELAKCQVLCRNCHEIKSMAELGNVYRGHGTETMYNKGCKCRECVVAHSSGRLARKHAIKARRNAGG